MHLPGATAPSLLRALTALLCVAELTGSPALAVPVRIRARSALDVHVERSADGLMLRGSLTDDAGAAVAREAVLADVEGLEPRMVRTGPGGEFELFIARADAEALAARLGERIGWSVRYEGGSSFGPVVAQGDIHLAHDPTRLTLELDPAEASIDGEAIAIRARISGPSGPLDEAEIHVQVADGPELIGETDAAGRVTFLLRPDDLVRAGTFRISARYLGDARFAPANATAALRVLRGTRISLRVGREGDLHTGRYRFSGRVSDDRGPLPGVTVAIVATELDGPDAEASGEARSQTLAVTNADGVYIVGVEARQMVGRAGGVIEARAAYQPTDGSHSPALSRPARIPVPGPPGVPLGWYVAALAASVGVVLLAMAIRMRFWEELARVWAARRLARRQHRRVDDEPPVVVEVASGEDLRPDWIAGRVVDAHTGRGVFGARCSLTSTHGEQAAVADPFGRFVVGPLPSGSWVLRLEAPVHLPREQVVQLPHDGSLDGATLALISVKGRVRDVFSRSLARYQVDVVWGHHTPAEALAAAEPVGAEDLAVLGDMRQLVEVTWFGPGTETPAAARHADELRDRLGSPRPAP